MEDRGLQGGAQGGRHLGQGGEGGKSTGKHCEPAGGCGHREREGAAKGEGRAAMGAAGGFAECSLLLFPDTSLRGVRFPYATARARPMEAEDGHGAERKPKVTHVLS